MISTLITVPYNLARLPLVMVDNTLSDKLPETSGPRLALDRAIGSVDKFAGALLGNHDIAKRGADRIERSAKVQAVARLEEDAATARQQARQSAEAGREKAAQKRKAAQDRAASGLQEAETAEARGKQQAKAKAAKTASAKKAAADKRAATRTTTVAQRKARGESAAEAMRKVSQGKATAELKDANKTKRSAAETRADANRLSNLAETKKQQRKQA